MSFDAPVSGGETDAKGFTECLEDIPMQTTDVHADHRCPTQADEVSKSLSALESIVPADNAVSDDLLTQSSSLSGDMQSSVNQSSDTDLTSAVSDKVSTEVSLIADDTAVSTAVAAEAAVSPAGNVMHIPIDDTTSKASLETPVTVGEARAEAVGKPVGQVGERKCVEALGKTVGQAIAGEAVGGSLSRAMEQSVGGAVGRVLEQSVGRAVVGIESDSVGDVIVESACESKEESKKISLDEKTSKESASLAELSGGTKEGHTASATLGHAL